VTADVTDIGEYRERRRRRRLLEELDRRLVRGEIHVPSDPVGWLTPEHEMSDTAHAALHAWRSLWLPPEPERPKFLLLDRKYWQRLHGANVTATVDDSRRPSRLTVRRRRVRAAARKRRLRRGW